MYSYWDRSLVIEGRNNTWPVGSDTRERAPRARGMQLVKNGLTLDPAHGRLMKWNTRLMTAVTRDDQLGTEANQLSRLFLRRFLILCNIQR